MDRLPNLSSITQALSMSASTPTLRSCTPTRAALGRVVAGLTAVGIAGCATTNPSREPLVSDRPDFTESTVTVGSGDVQLEGGYTFQRTTSQKTSTTGELLARIGLGSRAELRIEPGSYTKVTSPLGDASGREDGALGMKLRLHQRSDENPSIVPAVSLLLRSSIPTGTTAFRQPRLQPEAKLATAWTITDRIDLGTNINVSRPRDENGRYTLFEASASFGFDLAPKVGAFAEVFGAAPQVAGVAHTKYADTGLTFGLTPDFQLDVRVGFGLNRTNPDYFLGAGLVRRW